MSTSGGDEEQYLYVVLSPTDIEKFLKEAPDSQYVAIKITEIMKKTVIFNPDYNRALSIHEFTVRNIAGNPVRLDTYQGCVCIIVNVASLSPFADNGYKSLNKLYEELEDKGLRILAFPCNQFDQHEPGNNDEIVSFADQYKVQFDLFDKVDVNGTNASPLWKYLKYMAPGDKHGDIIKTNFVKFIVKRNGVPAVRIPPQANEIDMKKVVIPYLIE